MEYTDKRLPANITIYENSFGDFVACEHWDKPRFGSITYGVADVLVDGRPTNVKSGRSVDEAVKYYLSGTPA